MKLKTGILVIFLVFGLLGVPNCIFAQGNDYSSNAVLESSAPIMAHTNGLNPEVKGGGGKGGSSSISKSIKKADVDDAAASGDDGSSWWIILVIIVIIIIIAILVWYFFLRK